MKNLIVAILFFLTLTSIASSQNIEPRYQLPFNILNTNGMGTFSSTVSSEVFEQSGFLLGWHWNQGKRISEALKMSQA